MRDERISDTGTVSDASAHLPKAQQVLLQHWAETFGVALQDFHSGHIQTYEQERLTNAPKDVVYAEIGALLDLLEQQKLGKEIHLPERFSEPRISLSELENLPENVRRYITHIQEELAFVRQENYGLKNRIRRTNWGRSR